jgi:hypothetical protein
MKTKPLGLLLLATALGCGLLHPRQAAAQPAVGAPPVITVQPHDLFVPEGEAEFSVVATGGPLTYQWFHGEGEFGPLEPIPNATNSTLHIPSVQNADYGRYQVIVSNPFGSTSSQLAAMYVIFTRGYLYCRDGSPITNCTVTITLTNSNGDSTPKIVASIAPNGEFAVCFFCNGLNPMYQWWFVVTTSCCTNVLTVPTTQCFTDDLTPPLRYICNSCGNCPAPRITCPTVPVTNAECNQPCVPVTYPAPLVPSGTLDSCSPPSGSCFPIGTTTVTCRATNICGDEVTCQFPVIVSPCLICPTDKTVECGTRWDFDPPTSGPGCAPVGFSVVSTTTNGTCPQVITRIWAVNFLNATCELLLQCHQNVTVRDTTPPRVLCAPDKSVLCGDWSFDPPSFEDDGCSPITIAVQSTVTNGQCTANTVFTRTWIISDACGNASWCVQKVYQAQDTAPAITCPTNKTVQCGTNWDFDLPTVTGACSAVTIRELDTTTNGLCPVTITRTWRVQDECQNTLVCSQTVMVQGAAMLQTPFSIFSGRDSSGLLPLGAPDAQFSLTCAPPGVNATTPVVTQPHPLWLPNGPASQWIGPGVNHIGPGGVYCYTFNFTLPPCPNGNPVYSLTGRWAGDDTGTIHLNGSPTGVTLPAGWAFTNWHPISITSGLVPGPNSLTFYVTNASDGPTGLRLELAASASCCDCTTNCTVSITCTNDIIRETCGNVAHIIYPLPTATSSCGAPVNVVCTPPPNTVFLLGTTTVTCTATDPFGNTASCSFKVTVLPDSTPPVIDCTCLQAQLPRTVFACFAPIPNVCFAQCYSDNCTPAAQLTCTQSPPAGTIVPGGASYIITVTVTDAAGNSSQCQVGFTVIAPTDTRVWNTGGTGSQAANFTVIQTPGGPANIPAVLTLPTPWLANDAASSWVSFTPNSSSAAIGVYVYRLTFNLPCTNGASINGRFMSDDSARIWLNGVPTAALSTSYSAWTPVSLTSGFVSGLNTLDIYVTNAIIWTGIRTELTNSFSCCCPQAIALNCPRQALRGWVCGDGIANVPFNVTASSLCPSPNVTVSVTCVPPSPGPFPVGTTTVNCTATDSLGNTTSCSFPVVVVSDTIPPVITCPGPITRVLCSSSVAVYYKVIARDDCSPTVTVNCVPPSGTVFTTGTTIVTCTARDACGNTATCSFPVKVINNQIWQTLPCGINDCYAQSGWEPNVQGACLTTAYPGANWKNFDITTVNKWVGHTWTFPASWTISAAQLATRARPPINGCSGISDNDSFSLGLANCNPATWLWSRYLGSGNASPGLINKQWCNGSGCNYSFNLDLAALPLTPSGTISLLPHMNSADRLDLFFQDDSTVDFAQLRVLRCAPSHVIGGIGVELSSARLVYGPISWCIIRDTAATASVSARFSIGEADGLRLPIEPLMLSDHPGSALALGEVDDGAPVDRLRVALQDDGSAVVSLGELPGGVTHIDVEIEVNGEVVENFPNIPVTSGQPLVSFPGTEPLIELATANGNEVLASILSQDPGQPAEKQTLRVRYLASSKRSEAELHLNAVGIPEIGIQTPELQTTLRESPTRPTKVRFSSSDNALAEVSGGQCVVNPLYEDGGLVSLNALFDPTEEFRAVTPPPFDTFSPAPANAVVRNIVRGLIGGEEVDVDQVEFAHVAGGWDVGWSSTRVHPERRIYYVYGPAGVHRFEVPGNSNLVVTVAELPIMTGKLGGRTPCRRQTWPKPTTMRIGGESFEATELRILVEVDNYPVTALTGLRLEAIGAESLMVSGLGVGPEEYRLENPELTPDGVWLRWTGFGGLLEEAPTVLGPWAPTPGQADQTQGEVLTPYDPATRAKFFHVRGQ